MLCSMLSFQVQRDVQWFRSVSQIFCAVLDRWSDWFDSSHPRLQPLSDMGLLRLHIRHHCIHINCIYRLAIYFVLNVLPLPLTTHPLVRAEIHKHTSVRIHTTYMCRQAYLPDASFALFCPLTPAISNVPKIPSWRVRTGLLSTCNTII